MVKDLLVEPITGSLLQSNEERIREFQKKIYRKAKQEKSYRFYSLYDKICSKKYLYESYQRVRKNKGSSGVDGISFEMLESKGIDKFITELQKELKTNNYKPEAVKRVYINKANGKLRPLGIPTIKDRVVQMSCKLVIEPIFEARFENNSYGFRPKRKAKDAIKAISEKILSERKSRVFDADLSKYFDNIPHDKLMKLVKREISDKMVLNLIKSWLKSSINENGKLFKSLKGTPQGGVISPLLANIYLNELIKEINRKGSIFNKNNIDIISYADDFVLLGKRINKNILKELKRLLEIMGLSLNEEKSKLVNVFEERFKFLGFEIGYEFITYKKLKRYLRISPSNDSIKKLRLKLKTTISDKRVLPGILIAQELNSILRGWFNYFNIDFLSNIKKAKKTINWYLDEKLYQLHNKKKSQRKGKLCNHGVMKIYLKRYGLINPLAF